MRRKQVATKRAVRASMITVIRIMILMMMMMMMMMMLIFMIDAFIITISVIYCYPYHDC